MSASKATGGKRQILVGDRRAGMNSAARAIDSVGEDFLPVIAMLMAWGNKHASPDGLDTQVVDSTTYKKVSPVVVDSKTGKPINFANLVFAGGPANSPEKVKILKKRGMPVRATK